MLKQTQDKKVQYLNRLAQSELYRKRPNPAGNTASQSTSMLPHYSFDCETKDSDRLAASNYAPSIAGKTATSRAQTLVAESRGRPVRNMRVAAAKTHAQLEPTPSDLKTRPWI